MEEEEEVLKSQEDGLKSDFQDLKAQIEENELIHGIPSKGMSSIYIPRDPEHFRRQRKLILQRTLQVAGPRQITLQAEEMTLEQNTCSKGEFNSRTIPPLVAQYFLDRMSEIVIAKHLLLLRWKRFCSDTSKVEQVYQDYLNLLEFLTQEYLDASSRAHRLTSASESLLARNDNCLEDIEYEDYLIYWKHMIVKLQSQTYFKQIIALLKWFPYGHREGFKQDLSQRPQHLIHYDDDGGITEMLNRVIEKGPATLRAALANGLSTSTSEDGGGSADKAYRDQTDLESMRPENDAMPAPTGHAGATATAADSDTDDDIAGGTSAALSGSDSGGAARSASTMDSAPSRGPSEDVEPQEAAGTGASGSGGGGGAGGSPDGGMPPATDAEEGGTSTGADAPEAKQKSAAAAAVVTEAHKGEKRSLISGGGIAVGTIDQAFRFSEHAPQPPGIFMANLAGSGMPLPPTTKNIQYAACGGGLVTNERYHGLPLHTNDLENLRPHLVIFAKAYGIQMNIQAIRSSADEMELFSVINRNFRHIFGKQEEMRTFKCYDFTGGGTERWGFDSCMHAVKKPANWLPYVKIRPKRNADLVKSQMELRSAGNIDEILRAAAAFLKVKQPEKVQDALRHHAMLVQHPPMIHAASVVSHRHGQSTSEVFRKIYTNPELYNDNGADESGSGGAGGNGGAGGAKGTQTGRESYDFNNAMQMLGLDEASDTKDDPSSVQGAYLSFLSLRHLKIRDLQRTCISIFNYFRSIERTLTINDQGLSMNAKGGVERVSPQNHRTQAELQGHQGGANNLTGHGYLFNTPREFRIKESEFIQFSDVENHDDFYYHEDHRIHVRDQVGYWIVYDCALEDMKTLENDLLLLATHFIQKDKNMRSASNFKRKPANAEGSSSDLDIASYAHREVDRFGIFYDIWSNECAFQEAKKDLMDVFMEAYQHTCNRESRRALAQVMVDLMHQRPRIELTDTYFVLPYRYECAILRLKTEILKHILNQQIFQQREYFVKLGSIEAEFGLPTPFIQKNLIAPHTDAPVLTPCYLLELQPSLAMAANLAVAMEESVNVAFDMFLPTKMIDELVLEKRFYEILQTEVERIEPPGLSYSQALQRDLFGGSYVEDAKQMTALSQEMYAIIQDKNTRGDKKQRKAFLLDHLGYMMDLITLRHRLIVCLLECEVLAKIYLHMAIDMGYDEFHLFIRPIQFEAAKYKEGAEEARPLLYITAVQDDDSMLDKFVPSALPLAIHELDETHVGKFSFRGKLTLQEICDQRGVSNMLTVLKCQMAHKNALIASLMLACNARPSFYNTYTGRGKNARPSGAGTSLAEYTGFSGTQMGPTPLALERSFHLPYVDYHPEAFFSIQLEKTPCRDRVMNAFAKGTQTKSKNKKNSVNESEKLKRDLISQFCNDFSRRAQQTSLRAQIIAVYTSLLTVLKKIPNIADEFFIIGTMYEKKGIDDDADVAANDPRKLRKRPRRVLSLDGTKFYNLWFIPHFLEVLFIFRHLDDESCIKALRNMCRIASALHDIVHYLVSFARLGIDSAKISTEQRAQIYAKARNVAKTMAHQFHPTSAREYADQMAANASAGSPVGEMIIAGSPKTLADINAQPANVITPDGMNLPNGQSLLVDRVVEEISSYDGGPMSNLASELREIQFQIDGLPDPQDADQVVELLTARRECMFLLLDVCLSSVLPDTFLAVGNEEAYRELVENSRFPLKALSNQCHPSVEALELNVPEPLEPQDESAKELFPWLSFLNSVGPFPIQYPRWTRIEYNIRLCLAGLKHVDRPTVHGELLALTLALEDVLEIGDSREALAGQQLPVEEYENLHYLLGKRYRDKRKAAADAPAEEGGGQEHKREEEKGSAPDASHATMSADNSIVETKLSITETPIVAYALIKKFLILRKRVELIKREWGKRRLGIEGIDTAANYKYFVMTYRRERLFPLLRSLAIQYKQPEMYALGPFQEVDVQISPKGIPEMVILQRQLVKLIEAFENYIISDIRKLIVRQIDLVIKERNREEGSLPLDLWKKPAMKESMTLKRPALAEEFIAELMSEAQEDKTHGKLTFKTEHMNKCLQNLAISIMRMQRESYENYAMYYENLLKNQHSLLYSKEREVVHLKDQLQQKDLETGVTVQFQMSEQAHNLLLEVTALRAKIAEMQDNNARAEARVREQVRREFSSAMRKLFALSFEQKARIDEYRNHLHSVTLQRISEVRDEASAEMARIKEKSGARSSAEDELAERNLRLSREINIVHQKNIRLQQMMCRLKSLAAWEHTALRCVYEKQLKAVEDQRNKSKSQVTRLGMLSEQRVRMLNEEMSKLREYLGSTEKELNDLRRLLDKELKDKIEKRNAAERKAATDKQMATIKQMHIDQLMLDIAEKDKTIKAMQEELEQHARAKKQQADKSLRDVDTLKKRLQDEKKLKKIAIHKVDDLLSQVYEYETAFAINQTGGRPSGLLPPRARAGDPGDTKKAKNVSQSACRKFRTTAVTYEDLLRRFPIPYTPDHYLQHRRQMVTIPRLQQQLAHEILGGEPPATHATITEAQETEKEAEEQQQEH